jgi:hypothetical protein
VIGRFLKRLGSLASPVLELVHSEPERRFLEQRFAELSTA